ncbi:MAG: hypothetical protein KME42_28830 [Tildeniella nuda ZEHNDER 1965/U140]|nr:hypothetical protein [Tildeniella nuda ZEHNDER 1965/U140]
MNPTLNSSTKINQRTVAKALQPIPEILKKPALVAIVLAVSGQRSAVSSKNESVGRFCRIGIRHIVERWCVKVYPIMR